MIDPPLLTGLINIGAAAVASLAVAFFEPRKNIRAALFTIVCVTALANFYAQRTSNSAMVSKIADGQTQTSDLQKALDKERAARLPRTIPPERAEAIVHNLKMLVPTLNDTKLFIAPNRFDYEAVEFSKQIQDVLHKAGFEVGEDGPASKILSITGPGVRLWMNDVHFPPRGAEMIQKAFWMTGYYFDGQSVPDKVDKQSILITVGSKPANELSPPFPIK